jgi:hypothetical protein
MFYYRYNNQGDKSPFYTGTTATLDSKALNLAYYSKKLVQVTFLIYRLLRYNLIKSFTINCKTTLIG